MNNEIRNNEAIARASNSEMRGLADLRELSSEELEKASGGRTYRITNIRVNANGITGGGPIP